MLLYFITYTFYHIFSLSCRCECCKNTGRQRCYHWAVGDERSITIFQQQLRELLDVYMRSCGSSYQEIKRASQIVYDPNDLTRSNNELNVEFIPHGETEQEHSASARAFSNLITRELRLRKLSILGSLEDRRRRLREFLKTEVKIDQIMQAVERGEEGKEAAMILLEQAIPCIMHLENRVGEKILTVLLSLGADLFQRRRRVKSLTNYANGVQHIVNTTCLGTRHRPKQWRLHLGKKNDTILKVSLSNKKTRKLMDTIGNIIDHIFQHPDDAPMQNIWHSMMQKYNSAIRILRKKSEYTNDDIARFQELIDDFFLSYIEDSGAGKEGVTNYLHMLASGHIKYYMTVHRNLYKFSQQGWESLNAKYKLTFFNHTQRGGNFGKDMAENERSYLKPIFMAFQREIFWISGIGEDYFLAKQLDR